jgi:hypothetical protein
LKFFGLPARFLWFAVKFLGIPVIENNDETREQALNLIHNRPFYLPEQTFPLGAFGLGWK